LFHLLFCPFEPTERGLFLHVLKWQWCGFGTCKRRWRRLNITTVVIVAREPHGAIRTGGPSYPITGRDSELARRAAVHFQHSLDRPARWDLTHAKAVSARRARGRCHGMLFDFGRERAVTFWMRNTYIPLDMTGGQ
jgi:hypothetical protein